MRRKDFLLLLTGVGCAALIPAIPAWPNSNDDFLGRRVRIRPVAGLRCRPSFQRFCERSSFASFEEALNSIKYGANEFELYLES